MTIENMKIEQVGNNTVTYSAEYAYENTEEGEAEENAPVTEEKFLWFQVKGPNDSDWKDGQTAIYVQPNGGWGTSTYDLQGRVYYRERTGSWQWHGEGDKTYEVAGKGTDECVTDGFYRTCYEYSEEEVSPEGWVDSNGNPVEEGTEGAIKVEAVYRYWCTETYYALRPDFTGVEWAFYGSSPESIKFYPRPKLFTFANCQKGNQWQIDLGINNKDAIYNLTTFQSYANQWKAWQIQKPTSQYEGGTCPSWDSPLGATRMNQIHNWVGTGKSYSKGAKVGAAMFNSLADTINDENVPDDA